MTTDIRYRFEYDDLPDLSHYTQTDEDGNLLFGDVDVDTIDSYIVHLERKCKCCDEWTMEDVLGGIEFFDNDTDNPGPGTHLPDSVPEWVRESFDEEAAVLDDRPQVSEADAEVLNDLISWVESFQGEPDAFDSDSEEAGQERYEAFLATLNRLVS